MSSSVFCSCLLCVCAVRHSLVYRFCGEDGQWAPKNTSECEDDPAEVRERPGRLVAGTERDHDCGLSPFSVATVRSRPGSAADHVHGGLLAVPGGPAAGPGNPGRLQVSRAETTAPRRAPA